MTGPEDSHGDTRPISVAELLARNGTIGAPPVGGRRRRRRGNADSVTVAELTGEIPIIRQDQVEELDATADRHMDERGYGDANEAAFTNGHAEHMEQHQAVKSVEGFADEREAEPKTGRGGFEDVDVVDEGAAVDEDDSDDDYADAVADYAAHIEHRDVDPDPVDFFAPTRRPHFGGAKPRFQSRSDAEQMSPDPVEEDVDDEDLIDSSVDLVKPLGHDDATAVIETEEDNDEVPSYLRSTQGPLFGGQTVADDIARRGFPGAVDHDRHEASDTAEPSATSFLRGMWIVGQCMIAVAFGAGLFIAFDQLWKWNNIVALVLSVLVILGLVVGVRVVRKTEDIGSTLIAVAVGALVTLGPLALLQSG